MIWQAVRAGFTYFQQEAGYTRTGSHGTRVHGRETGQWHEADLAVAHWLQHTSRDGDSGGAREADARSGESRIFFQDRAISTARSAALCEHGSLPHERRVHQFEVGQPRPV
jgi:hypothetical protein